MANIQFFVELDLIDKYVPAEDITVVQESFQSVEFFFDINKNGSPADLAGATDFVFALVKPDGHVVLQNDATLENGKVKVVVNPEAFTAKGKIFYQMQYKIGSAVYNTRQAFAWVEQGNTSCQSLRSTDYAPFLDQSIELGKLFGDADNVSEIIASPEVANNALIQANINSDNILHLDTELDVTKNNVAAVSIESFGAKDDGKDVSGAFEQAFNYAVANNLPLVKCSGGKTYKLEKVIEVPDNVAFDGGNSLFLFENKSGVTINPQVGRDRQSWRGVFTMWGKELTETTVDLVGYDNSACTIDLVELRVPKQNNYTGRWKVSNAVSFFKGDFVKVYVPFRGMTFNEYYPVTEIMAKVIEVDKVNNYVYTDYYSPFDYSNYTWRAGTDVMVKVEPKKNISISNVRIKDISPNKNRPPLGQALTDGVDRHLFPCGIGIAYGFNINVENVQFENMKFSGVTQYYSHTFSFNGVIMDSPAFVGPGEGYANQNMNAMNGVVESVRGYGAPRHLVDISSGAFINVRNCIASTITNSAFDLHGEGEHDILYENCIGSFAFGNGLSNFNDLGHNVTLIKCKGSLEATGYSTNLVIDDSDIFFGFGDVADSVGAKKTANNTSQITISNSVITLQAGNKFENSKRGRQDPSWFKLINCKLKALKDTQFRGGFPVISYDHVILKDCDLSEMAQGYSMISIEGAKKVTVKDSNIKDTVIYTPNKGVPFIDYQFSGNYYEYTEDYSTKLLSNYDAIIRTDGIDGAKGAIKSIGNTVNVKRSTGRIQNFVYVDPSKNVGSELHFTLKDNTLYADNPSMLRANVTLSTTIKLTAGDNHFYDNVNKKPFTGSLDLGLRYYENTAY